MIVDAHTHLLPERMATAVREFFKTHIPGPLAYPIDHRQVLDMLHGDGIATVWNLPYAHKPGVAATLNDTFAAISAALADHPVRVITGCTVHPGDPDPAQDLRHAVQGGGAQVCKLHCSVGEYQPDDPRLDPVWNQAGELGIPVTIHAGHGASGHTQAVELDPLDVVAKRHPNTTIIIAHFGHHGHERAVELMDRHPNVWADLTPVVFDHVPLTAMLATRLSDRLLFGSDAPNTGHPASRMLDYLRGLRLSPAVFEQITIHNATRLLTNGSGTVGS